MNSYVSAPSTTTRTALGYVTLGRPQAVLPNSYVTAARRPASTGSYVSTSERVSPALV